MKVLGTGWAKTGTTSLAEALKILGYNHKTQQLTLVTDLYTEREEEIYKIASEYDSFDDWPWLLLYKEFDQRFPGTKFVLTKRNTQSWIVSYRKQLDRSAKHSQLDEWRSKLYGLSFPNVTDEQLIERYERHNADVLTYFAARPNDLLVVDWSKGDGWAELCAFLGKPMPAKPFPEANTAPGPLRNTLRKAKALVTRKR